MLLATEFFFLYKIGIFIIFKHHSIFFTFGPNFMMYLSIYILIKCIIQFTSEMNSLLLWKISNLQLNTYWLTEKKIYKVCFESIQPFWISLKLVAQPWCNFGTNRRRSWCEGMNTLPWGYFVRSNLSLSELVYCVEYDHILNDQK